ncbi:MAG: LexA family protein [Candidatus Saccharimonadales bacterium]
MSAVSASPAIVRPTKKQRELLTFIDGFIVQHGYSPSYREIMAGCNYTSVATVSLHVNNLIKRGHLHKKDRSARSLEVVHVVEESPKIQTTALKASEEKWLIEKIDYKFRQSEESSIPSETDIDGLYVLVGALKVLGLEGAASSFMPRLSLLKKRLTGNN